MDIIAGKCLFSGSTSDGVRYRYLWKKSEVERPAGILRRRSENRNERLKMGEKLTIEEFQNHIRDKYSARDIQRGSAPTFMWLIEEIGELATALQGDDRDNQEEEFADVVAWLCTMANIHGINLTSAIEKKYFKSGGPKGFK